MTESIEAPEALDREKALTLAAVAAAAWCGRRTTEAQSGRLIVERLMLAASWVSRARRHCGLPALGVSELVRAVAEPVAHWLPSGGTFALVEDGQPTPICQDLADDAGPSPLAEVEQHVIRVAMNHLLGRDDGADAYTAFRRFLVEHAHAGHSAAAAAVQSVGVDLARVYQRVPTAAVISQAGGTVFYPCPRCRWPMSVQGTVVSCHRSVTCMAAGARFHLRDENLIGLGRLAPPEPVSEQGMASLRPGVWRFTVLPGLEELDLERRLGAIEGVAVQLWPFVDAYDLDVRRGEHHWRIDVKDHSSAATLARHLSDRPSREPTWIVVPDARKEQIPVLQRLVASDAGYQFAYASEIVRRVKGVP